MINDKDLTVLNRNLVDIVREFKKLNRSMDKIIGALNDIKLLTIDNSIDGVFEEKVMDVIKQNL